MHPPGAIIAGFPVFVVRGRVNFGGLCYRRNGTILTVNTQITLPVPDQYPLGPRA